MNKTNIINLMQCGSIRVPKVQREYAQGRPDEKARAIRKRFVHDLFNAVLGEKKDNLLNLDLMYGLNSKGGEERSVFLPIDGQQRLTTLFLLAWFCGKIVEERWTFDYKSRRVAKYFMIGLRDHPRQGEQPSEELAKATWFHPSWKLDPSVSGMITMLDEMYGQRKDPVATLKQSAKLENIEFYVDDEICGKNLEEEEAEAIYGHLFLKMNARGLPLTEWEVEKNEIDQYAENNPAWRNNINGIWQENLWPVMPKADGVKNRSNFLDTAMSKIVGICADICGKHKDQDYSEWLCTIDSRERETFFQWCEDAFCCAPIIEDAWSQDRCNNGLWRLESAAKSADANELSEGVREKDSYAEWLTGSNAASAAQELRFAFLVRWKKHVIAPTGLQMISQRCIRALLNLLDNTDITISNKRELLQQGLHYLSDEDWNHLEGFHKEQLADEKWKATFDEEEIVGIERDSLVWRGSTAFLGERSPETMRAALSQLRKAIQTDRKRLFLSLLGLSGRCDAGLKCGSILIPKTDKEWAEECFSARRLFLQEGVAAWLRDERYNTDSGSSAWLNYLSDMWDTIEAQRLKRIATKDAGWLFCVRNSNLTNDSIRMVRSSVERSRLGLLAKVQTTGAGLPYITWGDLPYNGFMESSAGEFYFNVKRESWWNSSKSECYSCSPDGFAKLVDRNET